MAEVSESRIEPVESRINVEIGQSEIRSVIEKRMFSDVLQAG
jgi:hypothetical protein